MLRMTWVLLAVCLSTGCATKLPPKVAVPANARVGFLYLLDERPKHMHIGTTVFNNFVRADVSDWGLHAWALDLLKSRLETNKPYVVVDVPPGADLIDNRLEFMAVDGLDSFKADPDRAPQMDALAEQFDLDFLIVLRPIRGDIDPNLAPKGDGYGIYTLCALVFCRAHPLNMLSAETYATRPHRLVAWDNVGREKVKLDIEFPSSMKTLGTTEIDKAKVHVQQHITATLDSALSRGGL